MVHKGGFSFVAMLVINPIVILFYQNCSMSPITHAKNPTPSVVTRTVASTAPEQAKEVQIAKKACLDKTEKCARQE